MAALQLLSSTDRRRIRQRNYTVVNSPFKWCSVLSLQLALNFHPPGRLKLGNHQLDSAFVVRQFCRANSKRVLIIMVGPVIFSASQGPNLYAKVPGIINARPVQGIAEG